MAPSIFFLAASPEVTVSTLCPSRRSAISSISQIERSSSQTRILAMRSPFSGGGPLSQLFHSLVRLGRNLHALALRPPQTQNKSGSLALPRTRPYLAIMGLHNLVDDRQSKTCATFKLGLKGFEYFFGLLGTHARSGIAEAHFPVFAFRFYCNAQRASALHGSHRVLAKIPENLFKLVAIGNCESVFHRNMPHNLNVLLFRGQPVL